ncbi:TetR family transcriptional regulator [Thermopolyspora flexuosa]|jgi:AcrR family transcriptional regulator|uniref:TetR family transcriptional regulator n=1 Tax=Thermopolyspora flexuosa TaxID=103836 RepID=A0A543ISJ1_9ACTN|nr:TetR/AcrR family transcriptional regulator [Thermopolyspora flexuosa]TQM73528.1 TetR family transcriptional regulator [Thermopolyspora flexuosa]GGM81985.1 TetR family transcriptional regulator [Thermopolyspora flexuosa]
MERVAVRAGTGRAVLYRRWPGKADLAVAAIRHHIETNPLPIPDTGSLRGDLIALLRAMTRRRGELAAMIGTQLGVLFAEVRTSPAELRELALGGRRPSSRRVYDRAAERGELDLDRVPRHVLDMPFDLLRHDMLMTFDTVPDERITAVVDDLFLPLIAHYSGDRTTGSTPPAGERPDS